MANYDPYNKAYRDGIKKGKKKGRKQAEKKSSPYDMVGGLAGLLISSLTGEKTSKFPFK